MIGTLACQSRRAQTPQAEAERERLSNLLFGRQRCAFAGALVGEPLLPRRGVVGPLLHFDAPGWRPGSQEEGFALRKGEAARDGALGGRHQRLSVWKNFPDPRRLVARRGDDARAVRAEGRAINSIAMAFERLADRVAGGRVPDPRGLVLRRGDDAPAVRAERRASHNTFMASERVADRLAGGRVPDPRGLVLRRGDDARAVGAE